MANRPFVKPELNLPTKRFTPLEQEQAPPCLPITRNLHDVANHNLHDARSIGNPLIQKKNPSPSGLG